jgi:hypothetical protein
MKKVKKYNAIVEHIFNIECNIFNNNRLTTILTNINIIVLISLAILAASQKNPIIRILPIIQFAIVMWPTIEAISDDKVKWMIKTAHDIKNPRKQYQSWNI